MRLTRKTYATRNEKIIDFAIGFAGWFIVNGVIEAVVILGVPWLLGGLARVSGSGDPYQTLTNVAALVTACLPLLINIAALIFFGVTRYWIALGALAAFGAVLLIVLCIAVVIGVMCFASSGLFTGLFGGGP